MPGRHALHGNPPERRRHPVPVSPGLCRVAAQRTSGGPVDLITSLYRHPPAHLARRSMRGVRDERSLWGLPRPGLRDDRRRHGGRSSLHPCPRHVPAFAPPELRRTSPTKRKLSFKEQKELDSLPAKIEANESRQRELEAAIAAPEFYRSGKAAIADTLATLEKTKSELDVLLHRWTELEGKI